MIITDSKGSTFSIEQKIPKCKCTRWASIFGTFRTSHHENCPEVREEIVKFGFLKVGLGAGHTFICRVRSTPELINYIFKHNPSGVLLNPKVYIHCNNLRELADFLSSCDLLKINNIDARPLIIDRILHMRYYRDGKFICHEEYSYIEDEHETRKLYDKSPGPYN